MNRMGNIQSIIFQFPATSGRNSREYSIDLFDGWSAGQRKACCHTSRLHFVKCYFSVSCSCYRCMCEPGYTGQNCESEYYPCQPSPCLNDGRCKQIDPLTYQCQCPIGNTLIFIRSLLFQNLIASLYFLTWKF